MRRPLRKTALRSILLAGALLAVSVTVEAQQAKKISQIGFIVGSSSSASSPIVRAFRNGLQELGYVEGKNFLMDDRYADGALDRIPALVDELIQKKVDVIVTGNDVAIRTAQKATKTIPIVMMSSVDPVTAGYVASLARPGGNVTGISPLTRDLSAKRV